MDKSKKNALSGFNMKSYLKQDKVTEKDEENVKGEPQKIESEKKWETKNNEKNVTKIEEPVSSMEKTKEKKAKEQDKIAFMNYLPKEILEEFGFRYLRAKNEIRTRKSKALSQTELVEALIRYTLDDRTWGTIKDEILKICEEIVDNRTKIEK